MAFRLPGLDLIESTSRRGVTSLHRGRRGTDECAVEVCEEPCDAAQARRVRRIAVARARAADPTLPRVLAIGSHEDRPFIVTAAVPGEPLSARIDRDGLDLLLITRKLVSAIVELASRGIAHGRLSADDIVVDGAGLPRLLGAGIGPQVENDFRALGVALESAGAARDSRVAPVIERLKADTARKASVTAVTRDLAALNPAFASVAADRSLARPAELERLRRAWEDARSGNGRIVTLTGARGAGKSAVAHSFLAEIGDAVPVLRVSAVPEDGRRFAAIERLFESLATPAADLALLRAAAEGLDERLFDTIGALGALGRGTSDAGGRDLAYRVAESSAELFVRWSSAQPLVVFVDDVEALDLASAHVLERILARAGDAHALFLLAGSDPTLTRWAPSRALIDLEIPRLARHEAAALVRLELEPATVAPEVETHVVALSDATPQGVLEVTRTLLENQVIDLDWGRWRLNRERAQQVPEPVNALVARRARALGPMAERLLDAASRVSRASRDRLAGELDASEPLIDAALIDAGAAGLCRADGDDVVVDVVLRRTVDAPAPDVLRDSGDGMALLEAGRAQEGLGRLESAASAASDPLSRARLWLDVAWTYDVRLEPERAEQALARAFDALSLKPPVPRRTSLLGAVTARLGGLRSVRGGTRNEARERLAAEVYARAAKLACHRGQSLLAADAALRALDPAERSGHTVVGVEARMLLARLCAGTGLERAGDRLAAVAGELTRDSRDPSVEAAFVRWDARFAFARGQTGRALEGDRFALAHTHAGLEPLDALAALLHFQHIEALRGNPAAAWDEVARAIERVRSNRSVAHVPDVLADVTSAVLASLGRDAEAADALFGLDDRLTATPEHSIFAQYAWGARVRLHTERGSFDDRFETLVARFEREFVDPKQVPLIAVEHYVHVLHARIHAALRAEPSERAPLVAALARSLTDLRAAQRIPLHEAHLRVGEAHAAFFDGNARAARKALADAEALGTESDAPWIIYSVARARAHLLVAEGRIDAARDQAAMAEIVARSSGSAYRLRWIREELSLSGSSRRNKSDARFATGGSTSTERLRLARPLDALRRASEHRETTPAVSELLRSIVVELCEAFAARRALAYRSEDGALARVDSASIAGENEASSVEPPAALLHEAISSRSVVIADDADALCSRAVLPVAFDDTAWGVICLERPGCGAFSDEDRYSLSALAAQATLTLQLSRRRRDAGPADSRARAAEELRAVTDFADSVARDLDGVFGAIHDSVESAFLPVPEQQLSVLSTTEKARAFVQRLEAFARHRAEEPRITDLNDVLLSLEQVLRPLVRAPAELVVNLDPELYPALVDPWVLEQLLVSLTLNARRAMRGPGVVVLQSTNTDLDERASANRATPGPYAMISLASEIEVPTDPAGQSSFDAIDSWLIAGYGTRIHAAGGYVSTQRDAGVGQTCRVCLPARPKVQAGSGVVPRVNGRASVLLVIRSDAAESRALASAFAQDNFAVHAATDDSLPRAPDAVVAELDPSVPELAQALGERFGAERVLFLSGHPKSLLMHLGILPNGARFLQLPASHAWVVARIRRLLADSSADSATSTPITRR